MTDRDPADGIRRIRADVQALSAGPRHRSWPGSLEAARAHCTEQLHQGGWDVVEDRFTASTRPRMSDRGRPGSPLAVRIETALGGTNLIASRSAPAADDVLVVAHLDTVSTSPGADDNASGVAVALELARRITSERVTIALVDLEEVRMWGSRHLARILPAPALVVCLDAVGYFSDQPNSQKLPPGFGVLFPDLTARVRSNGRRGDFTLCVHRRDSAGFARQWAVWPCQPELAPL